MNAEFIALALAAAINPSLLAVDLLLVVNRRPRAMFGCVLIGGLGMAVLIGLLDVLVIRSDVVKTQGSVSAGAQLAIGVFLAGVGALLLTGHPRKRRPAEHRAGRPSKSGPSWTQRALSQPRLGLAAAVGAVLGLPGAIYLTALHNLVTGKSSTANQVVSVLLFAVIEFTLVIVPLVLLVVRPEATAGLLKRSQDWLSTNGRELLAYICLGLGGYLVIAGLVSLS